MNIESENNVVWNKGLTKETDERVRNLSIATSKGMKNYYSTNDVWNKGLNKKTDERIRNSNWGGWNKGLTKETNEIIKRMAEIKKIRSKGKGNSFYGKKHTDETKRKIGKANGGEQSWLFGIDSKKHPSWKGGKESYINALTKKVVLD